MALLDFPSVADVMASYEQPRSSVSGQNLDVTSGTAVRETYSSVAKSLLLLLLLDALK